MFALKLAWRDSRRARRKLLLFVSAMALGVASLVSIRAFGYNLDRALESQAKELFGADVRLFRRAAFSKADEALLDSLAAAEPVERGRRVEFASMAVLPGGTRLVGVVATRGPIPFYGKVETVPASAAQSYQADGDALVDATLMVQYSAEVGDSVSIGERRYRIAGRIEGVTGQPEIGALVGPRVLVPLEAVDPALFGRGSRLTTYEEWKITDGSSPDSLVARYDARFQQVSLRTETASGNEGDWSSALGYLTRFLQLVGFVALLLGGLGVASSIHVYVRQKADSVATLRCLGVPARTALAVFVIQAAAMGALGALLGALLGVGVQQLLPRVLGAFLPVDVPTTFELAAVLEGLGIGMATALGFALLPLVGVRRIEPMRAIRQSAGSEKAKTDPLAWLVGLALLAGVVGFAYLQTGDVRAALAFAGGTAAAFGLLALAAVAVRALARRLVPAGAPFWWRQGLANLYRPGNQTLTLLLTLGLGTFLVATLWLVQRSVLGQVELPADGGQRPDLILFDIQSDQRQGVRDSVEAAGGRVVDAVPMVSMRITAVDGRETAELRLLSADTSATAEAEEDERGGRRPAGWALRREYRSTFRDQIVDSETVIAGTFTGTVPADTPVVPISMEQDLAKDLNVGLGSRITWDVQGVPIQSEVTSLRAVDWAQVAPNFFVVFPAGPLDEAPQFGMLTARVGSAERSAAVQRAVVRGFPNVSAIDVTLVLQTLEGVLARVAFVLQFMAGFSLATGLVVLAGAVLVARTQRTEEGVLLRTLGGEKSLVRRVFIAEYAALGLLGAIVGLALALVAAWLLARFAFEVPFRPAALPLLAALVGVPVLTVLVGLAGSRGLLDRPPLDVLRDA